MVTEEKNSPRRILVIRLQAMGDVVIMLPYIYDLRKQLPDSVQMDLLTRKETESIPRGLNLFNRVYALGGRRNTKLQFAYFFTLLPILLLNRYQLILDLQNNRLSSAIRFFLGVSKFVLFDRVSPIFAGDRYKNTIHKAGDWKVEYRSLCSLKFSMEERLLEKFGLKAQKYIILNPGGFFTNRNWPIENYLLFCKLWEKQVSEDQVFLMLGTEKIFEKECQLKPQLGAKLVSIISQTNPFEAFLLVKNALLTISEDSGLLHFSYTSGTPTIGILGSTRSDWTNPLLPHTFFFHSSDLPCGNCMLAECKFSEPHCITRVSAEEVVQQSKTLLHIS